MGKIGGWAAQHDDPDGNPDDERTIKFQWRHDDTGQYLEVTKRDFYNITAWDSAREWKVYIESNMRGLEKVRGLATDRLEANSDGKLLNYHDFAGDDGPITEWESETETIDLSIGGRIQFRYVP